MNETPLALLTATRTRPPTYILLLFGLTSQPMPAAGARGASFDRAPWRGTVRQLHARASELVGEAPSILRLISQRV